MNIFMDVMNTITNQVRHDIQNIEIVKAAIYASSLGTIIYLLRSIPNRISFFIHRYAFCSIAVNNNDASYIWLQKWLSGRVANRVRHLVVDTNNFYGSDGIDAYNTERGSDNLDYKAGSGTYVMFYKGYPITVSFSRERIEERNEYAESVYLSCLFRKQLLQEIIAEAGKAAKAKEKKSINLFSAQHHHWAAIGEKPFRALASLTYDQDIASRILNDAKTFIDKKEWYQDMGIPWRRGYLLYGPPGNGKTSLTFALASELKFDIYILNLAGTTINGDGLMNLLNQVPSNAIVLIEEIDEVFKNHKEAEDVKLVGGLTHTSLLNALDGVAAREGRIVVMTTNYKERISPALIRPGRADMHLYMGNATHSQAKAIFQRFFPKAEEGQATLFADKVIAFSEDVSMAALQNHLVRFQDDALKAMQYISQESLLVKKEPVS